MRLACVVILLVAAAIASYGQDYKKFKDEGEVPRISLDDAKKAHDDNMVVFIDARSAAIYKQEHIKGAINIPYSPQGSEFDKLPKGKKIIVYCS